MRFMIVLKGDQDYEDGAMPSEAYFAEMGKFNQQLVQAGLMLAGEGLHPSSKGARIKFSGGKRIVTDGPFAEAKELIAGFWIWQVTSKQEAIDWVKRIPMPAPDTETEVEIRELFETSCSPECTPSESHQRQNEQVAQR
ncbi:MAG: YciI family protein [Phycisphaerales bacterium]|nr:YciI family protein [Phycisphaerales bacterium]MCI0630824.1 YciI family protein [Phycisphaerales bacterium]MCI0674470.1 YciI family protein [Phycisphaerales bacterium]